MLTRPRLEMIGGRLKWLVVYDGGGSWISTGGSYLSHHSTPVFEGVFDDQLYQRPCWSPWQGYLSAVLGPDCCEDHWRVLGVAAHMTSFVETHIGEERGYPVYHHIAWYCWLTHAPWVCRQCTSRILGDSSKDLSYHPTCRWVQHLPFASHLVYHRFHTINYRCCTEWGNCVGRLFEDTRSDAIWTWCLVWLEIGKHLHNTLNCEYNVRHIRIWGCSWQYVIWDLGSVVKALLMWISRNMYK